jgi:hypothetical protein
MVADVRPLSPPVVVVDGAPPRPATRAVFGVPPIPGEAAEVLKALQQPLPNADPGASAKSTVGGVSLGAFAPMAKALGAATRGVPGMDWLSSMLDRMAGVSGLDAALASVLERRHAAYLDELVRLFEGDDVNEALRRAIPLGGKGASMGPAWRLPLRRDQLSPTARASSSPRSVGMGSSLHEMLEATYLRTAKALEEAGRHEEAAFVLATLLGKPLEAIELLERHGKLELAAQVAETHEMWPQATRLWFLAGKVERAIRLARRHGCQGAMLALLESDDKHKAAARLFRYAMACTLAQDGRYTAAVLLLQPHPEFKAAGRLWMRAGMALGGPDGMHLALLAWADEALRDDAKALIDGWVSGPGQRSQRLELVALLQQEVHKNQLQTTVKEDLEQLERRLGRALLRDAATGPQQGSWRGVGQVLARHNDLLADLPSRPPMNQAPTHTLHTQIRGSAPLLDAIRLPSGDILAARADSVVHCDPLGSVHRRFPTPADRLLSADSGARAWALQRLDDRVRVVLLDLQQGTDQHWCDITIDAWASTTDGSLWYVAQGTDLLALDLSQTPPRHIWKVPIEAPILALERGSTWLALITAPTEAAPAECWQWSLPDHRLRQRKDLSLSDKHFLVDVACVHDNHLVCRTDHNQEPVGPHIGQLKHTTWKLHPGDLAGRASVSSDHEAIPIARSGGVDIHSAGRVLRLPGRRQVHTRMYEEELLCADDLGRVLLIEPMSWAVLAHFPVL